MIQGSLVMAGSALALLGVGAFSRLTQDDAGSETQKTHPLEAPSTLLDTREIWVNRVEKEAESARKEAQAVREQNALLQKRLDVMDQLFQKMPASAPQDFSSELAPVAPVDAPVLPSEKTDLPLSPAQDFPPVDAAPSVPEKKSRFFVLKAAEGTKPLFKTVDSYLPAGTYARAVLTSGVVASTALNAADRPQPLVLRLVDDGHLPRGFRGALKDAVVIAACYGDLSSERVFCRLETLSWVEPDGTTIEKKVDGWVIGEDGRPGLRGEVVDRAGEVARESLVAGILSGMSTFFKFDATSSVYPMTPFGQTQALKGQKALQGAAGEGVGSALDKLAEFSIKRAEQMQPVILVASGRVVDVVLKSGLDSRPEPEKPPLTLVGQTEEKQHENPL